LNYRFIWKISLYHFSLKYILHISKNSHKKETL